ncbi:MAG: hypothetical protein ACD_23C00492G0003 [uncultured bacterium]|nr:MAG: hypothetical protein ACD_23C00492G0003 [uncultured bacterium]
MSDSINKKIKAYGVNDLCKWFGVPSHLVFVRDSPTIHIHSSEFDKIIGDKAKVVTSG